MPHSLRVVDDPRPDAERSRPEIDDFGFDAAFTESILPIFEWFYERYWRVESIGVENVPATGRALLVANHAGVVPWDGAMIRTAIQLEHLQPRHARMLVLDWAFKMPFLSEFMQRTGNVVAHPENAVTLLEREELVGVFPEGAKGASKAYSDRYQLKRFGRGGFVQVALATGAPIVPVAVVGAEELHPVLFEVPAIASLLGLPAFPVTPTWPLLGPLGMLPLPSKWLIAFGAPIETRAYGPDAASDPALCLDLSERVRSEVQERVYELLAMRRTPFY